MYIYACTYACMHARCFMLDDTPGCNLVNSMQMRNLTAVCGSSSSEVYDMAVTLCAYGGFTW